MTPVVALFLAASSPSFAQVTLKAVDLYRSETITVDDVRKKADRLLATFMRQKNANRRADVKMADKTKLEIENQIRSLGKFAYAGMTYTEYITSSERKAYITFDVVDEKDAPSRMPFRPAPAGSVEDPFGLLASWKRYSELGQTLLAQGSITTDRPNCPAFYCTWGSVTPELAELEKRFVSEATARRAGLRKVFDEDASSQKRAAALCLLAYLPTGTEVAELALAGLRDPAPEVRSAALQILSDLAVYHKDVFIDAKDIIGALDYPTVSDRSKALGVLVGLVDNPTYRTYVASRAAPFLVPLLKLEQPSNQDLAFTLLGVLSQQTYDRHDYASWEKWAASVVSSTGTAAGAPPTP